MGQRSFDQDTTTSPTTFVTINYKSPAGTDESETYNFTPNSQTTTNYISYFYRDFQTGETKQVEVASRRTNTTYSIGAATNGDIIRALLASGFAANGSIGSYTRSDTTYDYRLMTNGPAVYRETVQEYQSLVAFAGALSVGDQYVIGGAAVVLSSGLLQTSRTVIETQVDEGQGITTTKTSRWLAFGLTSEGSVSCRAQIAAAETVAAVAAIINNAQQLVFDGTEVRSSIGRDYGVQYRPSERVDNLRDVPGGFEDRSIESIDFNSGLDATDSFQDDFDYSFSADEPVSPDVGDVWVGSDGIEREWDGSDWADVPIEFPVSGDLDDGTVTVSPIEPSGAQAGDVWTNATTGLDYEWSGSAWVLIPDEEPYTVTVSPDPPVNPAYGDRWTNPITDVTTAWDGSGWVASLPASTEPVVTISRVAPASPATGDRWIEASTGREYERSGGSWVLVDPTSDPETGLRVSVRSTAPSSPAVDDLWVDSDTGVESRWSGSAWVQTGNAGVLDDGPPLTIATTAPASPSTNDRWIDPRTGLESTWTGSEWRSTEDPYGTAEPPLVVGDTAPPSPATGDQWIDTTVGRRKEWNGSSWAVVGTDEYGGVFDSGLNGLESSADLTVSTIEVPYPPDFVIAKQPDGAGNLLEWLIPADAIPEARELARLSGALAYGHAYGTSVTLEPWLVPTVPLAPFKVEAGGLRVSYLANSVSWEWDADSMVAAVEGLLVGVDGKLSGQTVRPWVPSRVPLTDLPTVTSAVPGTDPQPANTITKPRTMNPDAPGAFYLLLPTNGVDVFSSTAASAPTVLPFSVVVPVQLTSRTTISVETFNYTTELRTSEVELTSRTRLIVCNFVGEIDSGVYEITGHDIESLFEPTYTTIDTTSYSVTGYDIDSLWIVEASIASGVYAVTGYDIDSEVV